MKKILVIGSCGAGKSHFSKRLGEIAGLPVIHLDSYFWQPGWVETDREAWKEHVAELLTGESWVIDGNYSGTMDLRLEKCDTAIFLDFPRYVCTWRVIKRVLKNYGRTRVDLAPGCPEKIDVSFIKWTWNYPNRSRPKVMQRLEQVRERVSVVRLTTNREVEEYLASLRPRGNGDGI